MARSRKAPPDGANGDGLYEQVLPYLTIDINDIQGEIVKHTASYAYLAQLFARAKGKAADCKLKLDYQKGLAFAAYKQSSFVDGNGKSQSVTDTLAKASVDTDEEVVKVKEAQVEADELCAFWQMVMDAMYQRSYMLTKLAEMQQHELLLAGSEYNEGIRQKIKSELDDTAYIQKTEAIHQAQKRASLDTMKEAYTQSKEDDQ